MVKRGMLTSPLTLNLMEAKDNEERNQGGMDKMKRGVNGRTAVGALVILVMR